jgi:hypothetical protein
MILPYSDDLCKDIVTVMVFDVEPLSIEWISVGSSNVKDLARTLIRDVHVHIVGRKGKPGRFARKIFRIYNCVEIPLSISSMNAASRTVVFTKVLRGGKV